MRNTVSNQVFLIFYKAVNINIIIYVPIHITRYSFEV